ncbi:MAG: BamA/TamA family outer membrane protein, partial [Flavobacteriales bacterium]|nr:BamA/TamA family outer membrane protein [Flavobacteriales bacterium]
FSLLYNFKRDKRNFKSYPTKGYFIEFSAVKNGLGITKKENSSMFLLGSYRKYWELSNRFYFATSLKGKYSIERPPFALLSGLGYNNNFVRGYEFYVINGENYAFFKSQLRYALVKDKVYHAKILSAEKFRKIPIAVYPGVFFDAGYVDDKKLKNTNILNNEMLFGAGASLDLSTYYDIVFRVEYSINRMQEHGLFLHFIAPL